MQIMQASDESRLSQAEWVVLCLVREQPAHGFRAMDRLERLGYIRAIRQEPSSHGPVRSLSLATPAGEPPRSVTG